MQLHLFGRCADPSTSWQFHLWSVEESTLTSVSCVWLLFPIAIWHVLRFESPKVLLDYLWASNKFFYLACLLARSLLDHLRVSVVELRFLQDTLTDLCGQDGPHLQLLLVELVHF